MEAFFPTDRMRTQAVAEDFFREEWGAKAMGSKLTVGLGEEEGLTEEGVVVGIPAEVEER